jgi:hypothetical protein
MMSTTTKSVWRELQLAASASAGVVARRTAHAYPHRTPTVREGTFPSTD